MTNVAAFVDPHSVRWRKNPLAYLKRCKYRIKVKDKECHLTSIVFSHNENYYRITLNKSDDTNGKGDETHRLFIYTAKKITNWPQENKLTPYLPEQDLSLEPIGKEDRSALKKMLLKSSDFKAVPTSFASIYKIVKRTNSSFESLVIS